MLGIILGLMAYDTVKTMSDKKELEDKRKKLKEIEWRLQRPMTQGHMKKCSCRLCSNRRANAINDHKRILAGL